MNSAFILKLSLPFPDVILRKSSPRGSIHASTIVSRGDEDEKETMRIWFGYAIAKTTHFELQKPEEDENLMGSSREFSDYCGVVEALGYKVWDIQRSIGDTISIVLQDSSGLQKELSGRADFIISTMFANCQAAAQAFAVCVVEIQSKDNEIDCEFQLVTYLVLLMNRFGLERVTGILVFRDGRCRSYRASRNNGDSVYEQNDTFHLYQIGVVLPALLNF